MIPNASLQHLNTATYYVLRYSTSMDWPYPSLEAVPRLRCPNLHGSQQPPSAKHPFALAISPTDKTFAASNFLLLGKVRHFFPATRFRIGLLVYFAEHRVSFFYTTTVQDPYVYMAPILNGDAMEHVSTKDALDYSKALEVSTLR